MRTPLPLALTVLYVCGLGTACDQTAAPVSGTVGAAADAGEGARIAYVNADTLLANYTYLSDQSAVLTQREQEASADIQRKVTEFQEQVQSFQRRAQGGNLTPKQVENEQRVLAEREQELAAEQQRLAQEFQGEGLRIQNELAGVLRREVQAVQESGGYDYVLQYGNGSPVLAVNEAYDVTAEVLERMNAGTVTSAVDTSLAQ